MSKNNITDLILRLQGGDRHAGDDLFQACAARLRLMSRAMLRREGERTLEPSDLVQEVFASKIGGGRLRRPIGSREHFFSIVSIGMRQILIDRARTRSARKRQPSQLPTPVLTSAVDIHRLDVQRVLGKLEAIDPEGRDLLRARFELGLTWNEIASRRHRTVGQVRAECDYLLRWLKDHLDERG